MKINTNILSLNAQRNLNQISKAISRSLERLSSGRRINSARDDASGLALSSRLESQVRSQKRAMLNLNEAAGYLATADGALSTQIELAQRMKELAVQASSGTLSSTDRSYLQSEFETLFAEFERITEQTQFNGVNLLNGDFASRSIQIGSNANETISLDMPSSEASDIFSKLAGTGVFNTSDTTAIDVGPRLTTADFNGDGHMDIVSTGDGAATLSLIFGNGDGTMNTRETFVSGLASNYVYAEDMNGDGSKDIVMSQDASPVIGILWNNGSGQFSGLTTYDLGEGAPVNAEVPNAYDSLVFADLNGDGLMDIGAARSEPFAAFFMNQGGGVFTGDTIIRMPGVATDPISIQFGDINGDGDVDLLLNNTTSGHTQTRLGDGSGNFGSATDLLNSAPRGRFGDVDQDGDLDIVSFNSYTNSKLLVHKNNGAGNFAAAVQYDVLSSGVSGYSLELADMNGDGILDVVTGNIANQNLQISLNNGAGGYLSAYSVNTPLATFSAAKAADFNEDGINDLIYMGGGISSLSILLQETESVSATSDLGVSTALEASNSLEILDRAIQSLVGGRAQIGAIQNRMDFASNNAISMIQNFEQARSQTVDTDVANETAELVRFQVLQQAGTSVLLQANTNLQIVLGLLR